MLGYEVFARMLKDQRIVDLGCGDCEFARWMKEFYLDNSYLGIDTDITKAKLPSRINCSLRAGDYKDWTLSKGDAFVCLMRSECEMPMAQREEFYEKWFLQGASIGLVTGVYHHGYEGCPKFCGTHQTTPGIRMLPNEIRIITTNGNRSIVSRILLP